MRMIKLITGLFLLVLTIAAASICFARANDAVLSLTTEERMEGTGWWPTKGDPAAKEYAGEAACAKCHGDISTLQNTTPMYHAGTPASRSTILAQHPSLKFQEGPYSYSLAQTASGVTYSGSDGTSSDARAVAWAFGEGEVGQTYLLKRNDGYMESRLSYYTAPNALDITTGHSGEVPFDLQEAFGHALNFDTARRCFGCHTTAAATSGVFEPEKAVPGITCEACHGPGAKHVAAMSAGQEHAAATITNPASLSPANSVDFCGACHRTWADVVMKMPGDLGVVAVRFQPYRLEKSRCWGKSGDARITCIACHDPHKPLVREMGAYDAKCLTCHRSAGGLQHGATVVACKVGTSNCASCHMPRYEIPQTHTLFTDHDIRIVRTNASR
jgi:Cytochrome c554 and c-prime